MGNEKLEEEKLKLLMRLIRDLKYPPSTLSDPDTFKGRLAEDLNMDGNEALALLGFLLTRDFVRIAPDTGLFVNPGSAEARVLFEKITSNAS